MTATPIPRTLAMSVYGDLDISVIDELPPGRKNIITVHRKENSRLKVIRFLREEISKDKINNLKLKFIFLYIKYVLTIFFN